MVKMASAKQKFKIGDIVKTKGFGTGKITHIRHTTKSDSEYAYEKKHGLTPRYKINRKYVSLRRIIGKK